MKYFCKRSLINCNIIKIKFIILLLALVNINCNFKKKVERQEFDVFSNRNYSHLQNFDAQRSFVDKKKYHAYSLTNKLKVLIIIDQTAKANSAAISVNTGVMKEGEIYGLAHFTEHMLFLGSKKYPQPTFFVDFISKFSGKFNGFTDFDTTGFFFRVNPEEFEKSLDIFSRFFIDPLFDPQYIQKEINSVNSEFERNIQLDKKRREQILHQSANHRSHYHRFTTGNTQSILNYAEKRKIDLRQSVIDYYTAQYRPDNMNLILYGNRDVEYYMKLVMKTFEEMKKPSDHYSWKDNAELPFKIHEEGKFVFYQSINNHQELDIHITLPDLYKELPNNLGVYFKTLVNYKGKNSLLDILRHKGLSGKLKCGLKKIYSGIHMLKINLHLSSKGIEKVNEVVSIVFKYLKYLKHLNKNENLYNFVKRYYDVKFLFMKNKKDLMKYTKKMCQIYRKYPKKFLFTQHFILFKYNIEALNKFADYLNIDSSVILLGNDHFSKNIFINNKNFLDDFKFEEILNHTEKWYGTKYSIHKISDDFRKSINNISEKELHSRFHHDFSFMNSYKLPKIISLIRTCKKDLRISCLKEFQSDNWDLTPDKIFNSSYSELWHKRDRSFFIAKVSYINKFIFPFKIENIKYATRIRLITFAINHMFRHFFYKERLKQNNILVNSNSNGFSIKMFAFSENIKKMSSNFFQKLSKMQFKKHEFNLIKDEMKKDIISKMNLVPQLRALVNFFSLILKDYHFSSEILSELNTITYKDYNEFLKTLNKNFFVKSFVHGDITRGETINLFKETILKNYNSLKHLEMNNYKNYTNFHADLSGYYIFREQLSQIYNINHAILNFYQIGNNNMRNLVLAHMLKSLCGNIYFTQLRIKEQLGYTTKGKIFSEGIYLYYLIVIQGSTATPDKMDIRIENVVELMKKRLEEVDEKKFYKHLSANEKLLSKPDTSINKRTFRLWDEIITGRGYFNLGSKIKEVTRVLRKDDMIIFFNSVFNKVLRKLSIQEFSSKVNNLSNSIESIKGIKPKLIENKEYFRKRNRFLSTTRK